MDRQDGEIKAESVRDVRPWGNFTRYVYNQKCTVKIIEVNPNQKLSKQVHKKRDEIWVILDEGLEVELNERVLQPKPGDELVVPRQTVHRLASLGPKARLLEISLGDFDEDDIERFEDIYGRA